jgi:choline dehydrogenase-like flavoprotein
MHARRASTSVAYLAPIRQRRNLAVQLGAQVLRIVIDHHRASGVAIAAAAGTRVIRAEREVIVTAGAIGSPKLLMQSGIGPADHLQSVGVPVVLDLPGVGANLQDHLDLFAIAECSGDHTYDRYNRPLNAAWAGLQYLLFRNGPVASSLFETGGFWYADKAARSPDIQLHLGLGSGIEAGVARMPHGGVTLNSAYLRPASRGTVRLATADPRAAPLIDPNYWDDPGDRARALAGLRLAREILRQPALKRFIVAERLPGKGLSSDDELFDYACAHAKTDHHPVGTCRIGRQNDRSSVVDADLCVLGIERLRVADASVMPFIPSSNTNAPTIMIAEKGADHILGRAAQAAMT